MAEEKSDDRTVRMSPDALPSADPDATRLASAGGETLADATRVAPGVPRDVASRVPSLDGPADLAPVGGSEPPRDGIDALSDPYFSPASLPQDLTEAQPIIAIESPVESLPERRRRLPRWARVLLVLLALAVAAGVAYLTYENEVWGGKTVPEVVGMSEDEARAELEGMGFAVEVEYRAGDDDIGVVLGVTPGEGERVELADGVTLVVGAERTVPDVLGLDEDSATQKLYDAGATDVLVTTKSSDEEVGTVIEVTPAVGDPFVSGDQITLVIAEPFVVPDVEGLSAEDALAALEGAGLAGEVAYVDSEAEKNTVVACDPASGTQLAGGSTVKLSVSSPYPSSPTRLLEYFEATPEQVSEYLSQEKFSLRYSAIYASGGNARAVYEGPSGEVLHISDNPESGSYSGSSSGDVLAGGAGVGGVRYAFSAKTLPSGGGQESEAGVRTVMEACGLTGLVDTCTEKDVQMPGSVPEDAHFICATGRQDGFTWVVRIGGVGDVTGVVALVAPTAHFSDADLSDFGESVCDYAAYTDLFAR